MLRKAPDPGLWSMMNPALFGNTTRLDKLLILFKVPKGYDFSRNAWKSHQARVVKF
jgi:hypothetical protein